MSDELHRDIGRHEAQIEGLDRRVESMEKKLDTVLEILNQAKGGWKTLAQLAGLAAAVGGFIGWAISFFFSK